MKPFFLIVLGAITFSVKANAFQLAPNSLSPIQTNNPLLSGTANIWTCSGSVFKFEGQSDSEIANFMTNGHCFSLTPNGFALANKPVSYTVNLYSDSGNRDVPIELDLLIYSTLTGTDIALFRSKSTIGELKAAGVRVFELSSTPPVVDSAVQVMSGRWSYIFQCVYHKTIFQLREDQWTWNNSLALIGEDCTQGYGTSGSPVVSNSGKIVGISNTLKDSGQDCAINNPCEVDEDGNITVVPGRRYSQQTWLIYTCLDSDMNFDLDTPGCLLESKIKN